LLSLGAPICFMHDFGFYKSRFAYFGACVCLVLG